MTVIASMVNLACWAMIILIFVRVAFTWVSRDFSNPIFRFCFQATEPLLRPVRNLLPGGGMGGLDFSPMIVSFGLLFLSQLVSNFA
ncbi:MAG TPA: YggT family protein [Candidatus Dormibacteraeota bacterium]|nr:YggT family protein [Candidatus Dormibacteraeota bacterium]